MEEPRDQWRRRALSRSIGVAWAAPRLSTSCQNARGVRAVVGVVPAAESASHRAGARAVGVGRRRVREEQHPARRLRRLASVRALPRRHLRPRGASSPMHRMTRVARRRPTSAPRSTGATFRFKDDAVTLEHRRRRALRRASRRARSATTSTASRASSAAATARTSRASRCASRALGAARRDPNDELVLPVSLRLLAAVVPAQGLLGDGRRAPGPARGRRLEPDLHLLSQHGARTSRACSASSYGPRRPATRARSSIGCCPPIGAASLAVARPERARRRRGRRRDALPRREEDAARRAPSRRAGDAVARHARAASARRTSSRSASAASRATAAAASTSPNVRAKPSFEPRARSLARAPSSWDAKRRRRPRARAINRACARCHQVLFSRYPFTWEGGQRRRRSRRQPHQLGRGARLPARRLRARRCRARPATIPHAGDAHASLRRAATRRRGTRVCVGCHAQLRGAERRCARTRTTTPAGAGARVPRLPHAAQEHGPRLRAHPLPPHRLADRSGARRGRPAARVRALPRRQAASASSSTRWSAGGASATIARRWRRSTAILERRRCSPRWRAASRTSRRPRCRARRTRRALRPAAIAGQLVHPYPLVRYFARRALERLAGDRVTSISIAKTTKSRPTPGAGSRASPSSFAPRRR